MFEQTSCTYPPDYNTVKEGLWSSFYYTIEAWIMCNNWNFSGEESRFVSTLKEIEALMKH